MVDFIGIGVQRGATSWLYSCMHEHPEICAPEKEINFLPKRSINIFFMIDSFSLNNKALKLLVEDDKIEILKKISLTYENIPPSKMYEKLFFKKQIYRKIN
jgi:hypothetical protein